MYGIYFYRSGLIVGLFVLCALFNTPGTAKAEGPVEVCFIKIVKLANPGGDTGFDLIAESDGGDGLEFTLTSPDNPSRTIVFNPVETITVTEDVPEGWELDRIRCEGDEGMAITPVENGRRFECNVIESQATCVFENLNPNLVAVPALSTWGMAAAAVVLILAAIYFLRRKSASNAV